MTIPTATDPGLPPNPPLPRQSMPSRSDRFFAWAAGLGVARSEGWLGGVCAGIAARLRIDPLIVRGIFVVATLFGLPLVFVYALAWALLPDADGRIHARDLLHGRFTSAQLGILATAVIGLIPAGPVAAFLIGFPAVFPFVNFSSGWSVIGALAFAVGLVLVGGLGFLIVRAARRTPGGSALDLRMASADSAAPDGSALSAGSGAGEGADGWGADAGGTADRADPASGPALDLDPFPAEAADAPGPQPVLPAEATPTDIDAWRAQHAAWKEQDQAWRRSQQDAERAARDQARRERQAAAAEFAIEAAERRRIRRASNPRTSLAYVAITLGAALVTGATVSLLAGDTQGDFAGALGLFGAGLVGAVAMIIAGVARRRSGFVAFVTALLLVAGLVASVAPFLKGITFGDAFVQNPTSAFADPDHALTQAWGTLWIQIDDVGTPGPSVYVNKAAGHSEIEVRPGAALELDLTLGSDVALTVLRTDGNEVTQEEVTTTPRPGGGHGTELTLAAGSATTDQISTTQRVVLDQTSGSIAVWVYDR